MNELQDLRRCYPLFMKKYLLMICLFLFSLSSFAKERALPLCSLYYANSVKKLILKDRIDKFNHCAVSCMLANRCGAVSSLEIGIYKELWDLVSPGNAEIKDIKADITGIKLSQTKMAVSDHECNSRCDEVDWTDI